MPEELYLYLKETSKENYTDMSKYLVSLMAKDKREKEKLMIKEYAKAKKIGNL